MTRALPRIRKPAIRFALTATFGLFAWFLSIVASPAQSLPFIFTKVGPEYRLTLQPNPALYFGFRHTGDMTQPFVTIKMALGDTGPIFGYTPALHEFQAFFRARGISVSAPEDQDNDLMDDLWELQHASYLNPLSPNDANLLSPEPDAGGRNNLDYYRFKRGITALKEVISREVTAFNFGEAIFTTEAISHEVSLFNGESIPLFPGEVYSRETSVFNFESPLAAVETVSREVSAFNFGSPLASVETVSYEVSVFNGESVALFPGEIYSRETSVFNFGAPIAVTEVISREVSVNNTATP